MDRQTIEFYKKQMIADSVILFENQDRNPNEISFHWEEKLQEDESVILEMTARDPNGQIIVQKSQKIQQLNG